MKYSFLLLFFQFLNAQSTFQTLISLYGQSPTPAKNNIGVALALFNTSTLVQSFLNFNQTTYFIPVDTAIAGFMGLSPTKIHVDRVLLYHILPLKFVPTVSREIQQTLLNVSNSTNPSQPQSIVIDYETSITVEFGLGAASVIEKIDLGEIMVYVVDQTFTPPLPLTKTLSMSNFTGFTDLINYSVDSDGVSLQKRVDGLKSISVLAIPNPVLAKYLGTHSLTPTQTAQLFGLHVIPSIAYSTDLLKGVGKSWSVTTQSLLKITVTVSSSGRITLQGPGNKSPVNLIAADYLTDNGVMHVIDGVLLPDVAGVRDTQSGTRNNVMKSAVILIAGLIYIL